jgi:hypothetical protein
MELFLKLSKDVILQSVFFDGDEITITFQARVNNNWIWNSFEFDKELQCLHFKNVCQAIGISQKKLREIINNNI